MTDKKKILFTTVYNDEGIYWDNFKKDTQRRIFTYSFPRISSFGLRFIKENFENVDIMEYPTFEEFCRKLHEGYDIVGFSFFLNETDDILRMIKTARKINPEVKIWGGNYGILTPEIHGYFDKIFIGYAEEELAKEFNVDLKRIKHPPLVWYIQTSFGLKINPVGILFTTRGCPMKCSFCQTPMFCPKPSKLSYRSISEILDRYKEMGIKELIIYDENFNLFPKHTKKVVEMMNDRGFYWYCMTTVKNLKENWQDWMEMGMLGSFVGIESFRQDALDSIKKPLKPDDTIEFVEKINDDLYLLGFFVIGYEGDTKASIREDIDKLRDLRLDHNQIRILTPLPQTPLWDEIENKYGIINKDWGRYDTMHLVWNHPNFEATELEKLLIKSLKKCHPRTYLIRTPMKLMKRYSMDKGVLDGISFMSKKMMYANRFDYGHY